MVFNKIYALMYKVSKFMNYLTIQQSHSWTSIPKEIAQKTMKTHAEGDSGSKEVEKC